MSPSPTPTPQNPDDSLPSNVFSIEDELRKASGQSDSPSSSLTVHQNVPLTDAMNDELSRLYDQEISEKRRGD
ncbi:MAG TPA: hypothetical protein VHF69_09685 [Candidatus Synoicihabitans sp.]|nr:hypothetical protein [Candidatus Synoicihabitans sp.]